MRRDFDELDYHGAAGASEALTEERENDLRIALDLSHEEVQADVWISDTISTIALNWPGSTRAAVEQYEDAVADAAHPIEHEDLGDPHRI